MSGFEVAGIVLGVLPLAIETINSYRTTLLSYKSAQKDLNWLRIDLETEHVRLQNTCEILLHDIVPFSMVDYMIRNPFGTDWAKYNDNLRERLWQSWTIFQAQIEVLQAAIIELETKLCLDRNGSIRLGDRGKIIGEIKQKTSFTLKKRDYEALLSRIKSSNTILQGLAQQDNTLQSSRRRCSQARVIELFRRLSENIFNAMRSAITCGCTDAHTIGIELATRQAVLLPDDDEDEVATKFDYSVIIESVEAPTEWKWIKLQLEKADVVSKKISDPSELVRVPPKGKQKRVVWRALIGTHRLPQESAALGAEVVTSETSAPPGIYRPRKPQIPSLISNLCKAFHGKRTSLSATECFGHILAGERYFRLVPPLDEISTFSHTNTLRDILASSKGFSGITLVSFGYEERLQLALTLSNSILHTYNTPWLGKIVTLDDIAFLWGSEAQLHPEWWRNPFRPFVTRAIPVPSLDLSSIQVVDCPRMINTTILSLGALLIQIITGSVEESLEIPPTMNLEEVYARRASASRLESKVIENGGPNYAKAVTWCFDHAVGLPGFQNEKFCQEFYEVVIGTLEEDAALLDEQSRLCYPLSGS